MLQGEPLILASQSMTQHPPSDGYNPKDDHEEAPNIEPNLRENTSLWTHGTVRMCWLVCTSYASFFFFGSLLCLLRNIRARKSIPMPRSLGWLTYKDGPTIAFNRASSTIPLRLLDYTLWRICILVYMSDMHPLDVLGLHSQIHINQVSLICL